jgi:hypothetical protein
MVWTTILRPGDAPRRASRSCRAADYQTNARMLQYATRGDALLQLAVADATYVLSSHGGLLSMAADDHVDDLSIVIRGEVLELSSSRPLARLLLHGEALAAIVTARVNGRELPRSLRGTRRDSLIVPPEAWVERRRVNRDTGAANLESRTANLEPRTANVELRTGPEREPSTQHLEVRTA